MAAGGALCRYGSAESSQESAELQSGGGALHDRLVAYVHSLEHEWRSGVWGEHSYARERGASAGGGGRARTLLAPRAPSPPPEPLDVDGPPATPPRVPRAAPSPPPRAPDEDDPADAEEWEARLAALAPSAAHARLAAGVADALRRMRLERLAGAGGEARAAARRLRRALAPHWLPGAAPAWLQAALAACLPREPRRLYEEALGELRRAAPRLAERLTGAWAPPPPESGWRAAGPAAPASAEPWLVWVSSGCAALDARWERRLAAQLHTRVLRGGGGGRGGPRAAPPDAWCAAAAGAVRDQLTDALAEAGDRGVILGGVGAGAALCALLARGAGGAERAAGGVRGAVLLAGGGGALAAVRLPLLLVVGTRAPAAPRHAAHVALGEPAEAGARRVLEVCGADGALRLSARARRRLRLPQRALDAALVEECVRWAVETAEGEEPPAAPAPPAPRRHPLPSIVHQIDLSAEPPLEEYAHLPAPPAPAGPPAAAGPASSRSLDIVEGLAPAPTPHEIMQMPIVFADDNVTDSSSAGGSPVTVTSGKARGSGGAAPVKMTRVILAKRGGAAGARGPAAGGRGAPRRLLVRRGGGMRLVARHDDD